MKKPFNLYLSEEKLKKLKEEARLKDISLNALIKVKLNQQEEQEFLKQQFGEKAV